MTHNPMTSNLKVEEPAPLTYLNLDDPNDDESYLEMQKHHK